ncbi:hypothetical protein CF326_g8408 [Tilletia indica]|nr:hypothetical protein CF326_g8408 [Tilletia indica]
MSSARPLHQLELSASSTFSNLEEFKDAVRLYALKENFTSEWEASKSKWVVAVCAHKKECEFRVRAHLDATDSARVVVSTFKEGHVCAGQGTTKRQSFADHSFLKRLIQDCMVVDYSTKDAQIAAQLKLTYGIDLASSTVNKARVSLIGTDSQLQEREFQQVEAWLTSVKTADPKATTGHMSESGKFHSAFLASGAAKKAWEHCKPFVAVDGTFTKNRFNMVVLLAATMDADSNLVILAWALVPTESQATWEWFLGLLLQAFPTVGLPNTTIISDRQKGALAAIKEKLPNTVEAYCCWHLAENVKKHYGSEARRIFWHLAYAETKAKFDKVMQTMADTNKGASAYLADDAVAHKYWASYAFPGRRFGHVTSNLSEISNSALRRQRELPALQLMVAMYEYEMQHFHDRAKSSALWKQTLAPHPHGMFLKALEESRRMKCVTASDRTGLVRDNNKKQFTVELAGDPTKELSSCTCGVPDLMLFPCPHVCCLAAALKKNAIDYAWPTWRTDNLRSTYSQPYIPVLSEQLSSNDLLPPSASKKRGRPQKKRMEAGQGRKGKNSALEGDDSPAGPSNSTPTIPAFCNTCGEPDHTTKQCRSAYDN